ncbi:MAG: hypothetical protein STSR0008_02430 [Ignavibacterium sp.]
MKKYFIILFLFLIVLFFDLSFSQEIIIKGKIINEEDNQPLEKANISIVNKSIGTYSNSNGEFILEGTISSNDFLSVSFIGFETKKIKISDIEDKENLIIKLKKTFIQSQTVLVTASIGRKGGTPITFSTLDKEELQKTYTIQDIPEYLSMLPSTVFYSESGNQVGYTYVSIRGFDPRRISVSINGIPQNDPEDHNIYWVDVSDLLANVDLIQVQRGAGGGVYGYPAIGGSINIITSSISNYPYLNLSSNFGSYNTQKFSALYSSGLINNKYSIFAKLSQTQSSGYRDFSGMKSNSYYLSAVRYDDNITTQINFYGGPIEDHLAYTGLPKFAIKDKKLRKKNYSYWEASNNQFTSTLERRPEEIENFSQPHYELLNEFKINENIIFNSALFLVIGKGFFDFDGSWADTNYLRLTSEFGFNPIVSPSNVLIEAMVENTQYGWIPRASIKHKNGELIVGSQFRKHHSLHWGQINYGENLPVGLTKNYRFYEYEGEKNMINGFVTENYSLNSKINLLGELQISYHKYRLHNEKFLDTDFSIDDVFFNPRIGINYKINDNSSAYFSFAKVSREPRLKEYYNADESSGGATPQFEKNQDGTFNFDKPLIKPETMNSFDLGYIFNSQSISFAGNLFLMLFNDELVKNGQLDIFGQPIMGNAERTIHTGIELSGSINLMKELKIIFNATYSKNYFDKGNTFISYTNPITQTDTVGIIDLSKNSISGFPEFLGNISLNFSKGNIFTQLVGKYVGDFYSDNYDNQLNDYLIKYPDFVSYSDNKNDSYFVLNFSGGIEFNLLKGLSKSKLIFQVNNIFNELYSANAVGAEFFPAAERNFIVGLQLGL